MTSKPKTESSPSQQVFTRLVRSLSNKNDSKKSPPTTTDGLDGDPSPFHSIPEVAANSDNTSSGSKRARLTVSDRLRNIGKDLEKLTKAVSATRSSEHHPLPTPPESTATEPEAPIESGPSSSRIPISVSQPHSKDLGTVHEDVNETLSNIIINSNNVPAEGTEPTSLARKIKAMIDSLPLPTQDHPSPKQPSKSSQDADGRPVPPPEATPIKDSRLIALLSSATIMNGSGGKRPSVWSILESIGAPKHRASVPIGREARENEETSPHEEDDSDRLTDSSSVMVYSPIIPTLSDLVEVAETVPADFEIEGENPGATSSVFSGWTTMWPFSAWYAQTNAAETVQSQEDGIQIPVDNTDASTTAELNTEDSRKVFARTQRLWVPSTTKLSVQAMWWGYRLYLPPPVLDVLNDKQLEATKRAVLITTALTWVFNNLPIASFPPSVRPALKLLQGLIPFLGYIGTFISWSWNAIKSYDIGNGIILTATWLLPVALIPGTWHETDFPKSPSPSPPVQLPAEHAPSPPVFSLPAPVSPKPPTSPLPSPAFVTSYDMHPSSPKPSSSSIPPLLIPLSPPLTARTPGSSSQRSLRSPIPPVAPTPHEPPPVPPPVSPTSPLVPELLQSPILKTIPLPDIDEHTNTSSERKKGKRRGRGLLERVKSKKS